ncbi:MAG: hypothetical protein JSV09_09535 [Thermoplasmata archaeon]|nr:MAG: hypothetical protein JSV09_09535 [Thermoplasmata archaeon]
MKTYIEVFVSTDGEKGSVITKKLIEMGLSSSIGEHDFEYKWKKNVTLPEVLRFVDDVQAKLRGTGTILKFTTIR